MQHDIIEHLICGIRKRIEAEPERFPDALFTDEKYVYGSERDCHNRIIDLITGAVGDLPGVTEVTGNKILHRDGDGGRRDSWKPDVVGWNGTGDVVCVLEYESLNSSDSRVIEKDVYGYWRWVQNLVARPPMLIVTTLHDGPSPHYKLRYARPGYYNWEHVDRQKDARENPRAYWYACYAAQMDTGLRELRIRFANFNGCHLDAIDLAPLALDSADLAKEKEGHGSDSEWFVRWEPTAHVKAIRGRFKDLVWQEREPLRRQDLLQKFWKEEQAAWGDNCWNLGAQRRFFWNAMRVRTPRQAIRVIEGVQGNRY